jgi:AbrB family looped-hinge helix DNA binding protein
MEAQTTVDRFGRIVIPKATRDHFGLAPGTALTVIDAATGVLLQPSAPTASLRVKGGVLVFQGEITGAADAPVRRDRDERIRRFLPGRKR